MELADMRDLGSRAARRAGSSPVTRTRKGEIRTGFPLFWCRAFGAEGSAALKRERGFPSPLALSPCRPGSRFGFELPRCTTTSEEANCTPLPPGRRKLRIRWLLLPFQIGELTGVLRFGFKYGFGFGLPRCTRKTVCPFGWALFLSVLNYPRRHAILRLPEIKQKGI